MAQHVIKATVLINEIAQASSEQAQGIEQINKAMSEMDMVTQQTATSAEEMASSMAIFKVKPDKETSRWKAVPYKENLDPSLKLISQLNKA